MRKIAVVLIIVAIFIACSEKNVVESKWRVLDEQIYAPEIDKDELYLSLDELEKIIFAPSVFFREKGGIYSFEQNMKYVTESLVKEEKRELNLEENVKYSSSKNDSFKMIYENNRNEGWSMIWKDNFFYRKQFGGEFTKSFSMGEHVYLRESLFGSMPSIYSFLRNNADIKAFDIKKRKNVKGTEVKIVFNDENHKREPIVEKRYLQNLQGTEEMKDDRMIADFMKKEKKNINGDLILFVDENYTILEMDMNISFDFVQDKVKFIIEGKRVLNKKVAEKIETPIYNEEYHRRTIDSSINIMKDKKNDKE